MMLNSGWLERYIRLHLIWSSVVWGGKRSRKGVMTMMGSAITVYHIFSFRLDERDAACLQVYRLTTAVPTLQAYRWPGNLAAKFDRGSDTWSKSTKARLIMYRYVWNLATVATSKATGQCSRTCYVHAANPAIDAAGGRGRGESWRVLRNALYIVCTSGGEMRLERCTSSRYVIRSSLHDTLRLERACKCVVIYLWCTCAGLVPIHLRYLSLSPILPISTSTSSVSDSSTFFFFPSFPECDWLMHNRQLPIGPPKSHTRPMIHDHDPC